MCIETTHMEILVESSADKHSYETVDKPILILCIPWPSIQEPKAVENSLLVTLIARVRFQIIATLYPMILQFLTRIDDNCSATVARS